MSTGSRLRLKKKTALDRKAKGRKSSLIRTAVRVGGHTRCHSHFLLHRRLQRLHFH